MCPLSSIGKNIHLSEYAMKLVEVGKAYIAFDTPDDLT
jgi:hypothetical protein